MADGLTDRSTLPTRGATADAAYLQGRHEGYQAGLRDGRCAASRERKRALGYVAAQLLLAQTLLRKWVAGTDTRRQAQALEQSTNRYLEEPLTAVRANELTGYPADGGCLPACPHCSAETDEVEASSDLAALTTGTALKQREDSHG